MAENNYHNIIFEIQPKNTKKETRKKKQSKYAKRPLVCKVCVCNFLMSFNHCTYYQRHCAFGKCKRYSLKILDTESCWSGCSLFMRFLNLPPGDCRPGVQPLCQFQTYLQGTVGQRCSFFYVIWNRLPGDCRPGVQPVYTVSELTSGDC